MNQRQQLQQKQVTKKFFNLLSTKMQKEKYAFVEKQTSILCTPQQTEKSKAENKKVLVSKYVIYNSGL